MNYLDIIDNLIPSTYNISSRGYCNMYEKALEYLNVIKCSRFKAMYFGSLQVGPEMYCWKDDEDFKQKYQSCCIFIMETIYNKLKNKRQELIEISLCILYSMLALYVENKNMNLTKKAKELLKENDKFTSDELDKEFNNGGHN